MFFSTLFYLFVILHLFYVIIIIIVVLEVGTLKQNPFVQSIKQVKQVGEQVVMER